MITYRSFCSPPELLSLLIERFNVPTPKTFQQPYVTYNRSTVGYISCIRSPVVRHTKVQPCLNKSYSLYYETPAFYTFQNDYKQPIQLRVLAILNLWVTYHYYDFTTNPTLLDRLKDFLNGDYGKIRFMPKQKVWCEKIQEKIKKKQEVYDIVPPTPTLTNSSTEAKSPTQKNIPKTLWDRAKPGQIERYHLKSLHPVEIARQLTLLHFSMYRAIKPPELVGAVFNQSDKHVRSPQLQKFIDHINDLSFWVARCIIEAETLKERIGLLSRILEVMTEFEKLNNFTGLMAFFSALSLQPIYRLSETKSKLVKKSREQLANFTKVLSDAHHKGIIERLHSINPPCVPFFGIYLSKIVFVEAGYSTFVKLNQRPPT
uniref:Uncharacterized protein n=1 Tax=Acrobeloides nanus TaxID=290746 RepID=A0A914CS63_9BILA